MSHIISYALGPQWHHYHAMKGVHWYTPISTGSCDSSIQIIHFQTMVNSSCTSDFLLMSPLAPSIFHASCLGNVVLVLLFNGGVDKLPLLAGGGAAPTLEAQNRWCRD